MKHRKSLAPLLAVLLSLTLLIGCPSQQTYADIWKVAGTLADSYISIYAPNWAQKAAFDAAWAAAYTDILNFKTGQPCAEIVQAINAAAGILASVPVLDSQQIALMAAIVASIDTVTAFFAKCQPAAAVASHFPPSVQAAAAKLKPPKSGNDVKKLWAEAGGR